jgi:hypothetical protein
LIQRRRRQQAVEERTELPDLSSALEEYARNIGALIDIAEEKSVRLIFMTQPTLWKAGLSEEKIALLWFGEIGKYQKGRAGKYFSVEALEEGMERYNETLLDVCRRRGIECINLASRLEKNTTIFYDDCHFNESGARMVAEILSNSLLSERGKMLGPDTMPPK